MGGVGSGHSKERAHGLLVPLRGEVKSDSSPETMERERIVHTGADGGGERGEVTGPSGGGVDAPC